MEREGGVNWDKGYKQYVATKSGRTIGNIFDSKILSKDDFIDQVRASAPNLTSKGHTPKDGLTAMPMVNASYDYQKAIQAGAQKLKDGLSQGEGYHPLVPTGPGKAARIIGAINDIALTSGIKVIDLNNPDAGAVDLASVMKIDRTKLLDKDMAAQAKALNIQPNLESVGGKPTMTVTGADGTTRIFQAQNLPQYLGDDLNLEAIKAGGAASTKLYSKRLVKQGYYAMGSTEMTETTPQYLKTVNPGASSIIKTLSDRYSVKVKDAGNGNRRYILLRNFPDGSTQPNGVTFDSVDDLTTALGQYRASNILTESDQKMLNTQR
jgi:hypothetical protein